MHRNDWMICLSHILDGVGKLAFGLILAKVTRNFLFRNDFIGVESMMEAKGMNILFWKSLCAYTFASFLTYSFLKDSLSERYLVDLAYEYKYNFKNDLTSAKVDSLLNDLCDRRFNQN